MEETFRSSDKEIEPAIEEPKEDNIDESDNMSFMAGEFDDLTDMPSDTDYTTDEKYNITDSDTLSETDNGEVNMTINVGEIEEAENIKTDVYDPTAELSRYHFPSVNLLTDIPIKANSVDQSEMEENKERITETLKI